MSETPINLNRARKTRARVKAKAEADENAVRFGRTKAQKAVERADAERAKRSFEGHERADPEDE
ncbi:DUF4169 family protein [Roseovarius sp. S4756]|uniref:DUF4169 family protein n=1 Tax=Roseovarius maritimus TaxID=3342637 RepID=UPI0037263864